MKLSEIKGEQALDVIADIIEPITDIASDEEFVKLTKNGSPRGKIIAYALKNHKQESIKILAALELKTPEEYEVTLLSLPMKLKELFEDEEFMELFT